MRRFTAHLVGAGAFAPAFEDHLDRLPNATLVGSEETDVATLVFEVRAWTASGAHTRAERMVAPLLAQWNPGHFTLLVTP